MKCLVKSNNHKEPMNFLVRPQKRSCPTCVPLDKEVQESIYQCKLNSKKQGKRNTVQNYMLA